jgi:hypothetical protein
MRVPQREREGPLRGGGTCWLSLGAALTLRKRENL